MKRLAAFGALILLALPIAGIFGILHNQVSFTVSSEYFTKFKFQQFGLLDPSIPERIRVAIIGFQASWWMGLPIGALIAPLALLHKSAFDVLRLGLWSYGVLVTFTGLFALAGLLYGFFQTTTIDLREYQQWFIPSDVTHLRRFLCVGYMHNSAYLGGIIGVLIAWAFHISMRLRKDEN